MNIIKNLNNYLLLMILVVSCNNNADEYISKSYDNIINDRTLKVENDNNKKKIIIYGENGDIIRQEILLKKDKGYYRELKYQDGVCSKNVNSLILSLQNEVFSSYDCVDGRHDIYIVKLDDGNYLSVENVYGVVSYSNKYFYDKYFKILKIEQLFGSKKIEYFNTDNINYKGKISTSEFLLKIKRDSINYKKGYINIH